MLSSMRFRFDCVFYPAARMDRAVGFYRDVLGFKLHSQDEVARFQIDGVRFELVPAQPEHGLPGGANARLCLEVAELSEACVQLRRKGIDVSEPREVRGGRLACLRDPDGNEVYLWQSTRHT